MAMFTMGGDPEAMKEIAQSFRRESQAVGQARDLVSKASRTLRTHWAGADASAELARTPQTLDALRQGHDGEGSGWNSPGPIKEVGGRNGLRGQSLPGASGAVDGVGSMNNWYERPEAGPNSASGSSGRSGPGQTAAP